MTLHRVRVWHPRSHRRHDSDIDVEIAIGHFLCFLKEIAANREYDEFVLIDQNMNFVSAPMVTAISPRATRAALVSPPRASSASLNTSNSWSSGSKVWAAAS